MRLSMTKQTILFGMMLVSLVVLVPGLAHFAHRYHRMAEKVAMLEAQVSKTERIIPFKLEADTPPTWSATPTGSIQEITAPVLVVEAPQPLLPVIPTPLKPAEDLADVDETLLDKELNPAAEIASPPPPVYHIQMGLFSDLRHASALVRKLVEAGYQADDEVVIAANGRPVAKVMVTVAGSEMEARRVRASLHRDFHIQGMIVHE
jgi:hypothetical protein